MTPSLQGKNKNLDLGTLTHASASISIEELTKTSFNFKTSTMLQLHTALPCAKLSLSSLRTVVLPTSTSRGSTLNG